MKLSYKTEYHIGNDLFLEPSKFREFINTILLIDLSIKEYTFQK